MTVPLRFDDVKPKVAFASGEPGEQVQAVVSDEHSGPRSGQILYRRVDADDWTELPTKLVPAQEAGSASLVAPMPELGFGTYVFRADAEDAAGNTASSSLRADGTQMAIRRVPPPPVSRAQPAPRGKSRLFARLRGGHGRGDSLTVPFGAPALLSGRLTRAADGAGLGGRAVRVVSHPSRGALVRLPAETVRTGEQGGFELRLPPGPSRRVSVVFAGDGGLEESTRQATGAAGAERRQPAGRTPQPAHRRGGRLSGRVKSSGAPIPRRGKLVAIQYLEEATHRWRPVLVTRTDHHGRFRAHYRFRYVTGRAAIRLRATALAEERWPYAPGSSPPGDDPRPGMSRRLARVRTMSQATLHTSAGAIVLELHDEDAPKTVENFRKLSADGFYDQLVFHRVIPDFMIQGGCPEGTGRGGPGYTFEDEFNDHKVVRGALAMANAGPEHQRLPVLHRHHRRGAVARRQAHRLRRGDRRHGRRRRDRVGADRRRRQAARGADDRTGRARRG